MTPVARIKAIDQLSKHSLSWYKEEEYKENDFDKVLKHINDFKHNISVLNEEVRMVQHRYKTPNDESDTLLEETVSSFIKEAHWRQKKSERNLQQLDINIPFIEALEQMPKYAKFMKDLLSRKGKGSEESKIILNEQCSAVVLNKVPPKEKDLGGFTIPCVIRQSEITRALADLGSSISLMPCSMFLPLNLDNSIEPIFDHLPEDCNNPDLFAANSIDEEIPTPKLNELPSHLEYAFLNNNRELPIIISLLLSDQEKTLLLEVLTKHKKALAWNIFDIKGTRPPFCTHKFLMEENSKPTVQPQRRLNHKVQDVVKTKILKLLDAGLIYAICDSPWVSSIHVVPKKGGTIVIANKDNELIPT
ncbi:hypothetical protein Tco_0231259 [Tanacetum coccineum]